MNWTRNVVIKNKAEIKIMRDAGRINFKALKAVKDAIKPGTSTGELDKIAETVIRDHGGEPVFLGYPGPTPYPATLTVCLNEEMVHGIPGKRILKEGDLVSVDCGTLYDGFVADSAFSVGVGEVSEEVQQLLEVTERALEIGISKMVLGNRIGDVGAAIQEYVSSFGYFVPQEYTGHGVGRQMHEGPQVPNYGTPGKGIELVEGMTIALEPMTLVGTNKTKVLADRWTVVSVDGSLTAHFEHSVAVTNGKPYVLTTE